MKIHEQIPVYVIRIQISKVGDKRQYLTLSETTADEVEAMCKSIIESQKLSIFTQGHKTRIDIREGWGKKNGSSRSVSFKGLDTKITLNLIIAHLNKTN